MPRMNRRLLYLLLCPALLSPTGLAWAAPSPEEEALAAELAGRTVEAARLLQRSQEAPELSRYAATLLIRHGLPVGSLLVGPETWKRWALIDQDRLAGRVGAALPAMMAMLESTLGGGSGRYAAEQLLGWAAERRDDPDGAAQLLQIAIGTLEGAGAGDGADAALLSRCREALVGLGLSIGQDPVQRAAATALEREGLAAGRPHPGARLILAAASGETAMRLWLLGPVLAEGTAAQVRSGLGLLTEAGQVVPGPLVLEAFGAAMRRFPQDTALMDQLMAAMSELSDSDPATARAGLAMLVDLPTADAERSMEAAVARATLAPTPAAGWEEWRGLVARAGASMLGQRARAEALDALDRWFAADPDPHALALRLESDPLAADQPALLYHLIPQVTGGDPAKQELRLTSLRDLARRFPDHGYGCAELEAAAILSGAAERLAEIDALCPADSATAQVLRAGATGAEALLLQPEPGGAALLRTGAAEVSQVAVDPLALLQSGEGHPLDQLPDASLLEPQQRWELPMPADRRIVRDRLTLAGAAPLAVLTVRVGDQQASILVRRQPIRVEARRQGSRISVAGFGADGQPIRGGTLHLIDAGSADAPIGAVRTVKADADGIFRAAVTGEVRLMLQQGAGLGFAVVQPGGADAPPAWGRIFPLDREMEQIAAVIRVQLAGQGRARLQSINPDGSLLREIPVDLDALPMVEIPASAGGRLRLLSDPAPLPRAGARAEAAPALELDSQPLSRTRLRVPAALSVEPDPDQPGRLNASLLTSLPVPPEGLAMALAFPGRGAQRADEPAAQSGPLRLSLTPDPLDPAQPLRGTATVGGLPQAGIEVGAPPADPPPALQLPPLLALDAALPLEGSMDPGGWILVTCGRERRWSEAGAASAPASAFRAGPCAAQRWQAGRLSAPTRFFVSGPDGAPGGASDIASYVASDAASDIASIASDVGPDGVWRGPPDLVEIDGEARILLPGDRLPLPAPASVLTAGRLTLPLDPANIHSAGSPLRDPELRVLIEGVATRAAPGGGSDAVIGIRAPDGADVRVWVQDASDWWVLDPLDLPRLPGPVAAARQDDWAPADQIGQQLAAGLLEEEERQRESRDAGRISFDFDAANEEMGLGGDGYGSGMGGLGTRGSGRSSSVYGSTITLSAATQRLQYLGRSLGWREGAGDLSLSLPPSVTRIAVHTLTRTADGRWQADQHTIAVPGLPALDAAPPLIQPDLLSGAARPPAPLLIPRALSAPGAAPSPADSLRALLYTAQDPDLIAAALLGDPSLAGDPILAAMASRASHPLIRAWRRRAGQPYTGAANAPDAGRLLSGIGDSEVARRAEIALQLAPDAPDQALSLARRLAREELPPWVRARVGLTLDLCGADAAEVDAALSGDDAAVLLVRGVLTGSAASGSPDPRLWDIAAAPGAQPIDRMLALRQLARRPPPIPAPIKLPKPPDLPAWAEPPLAEWQGVLAPLPYEPAWTPGFVPTVPVPTGRVFTVRFQIPPSPLPARLRCEGDGALPAEPWQSLPPADKGQIAVCRYRMLAAPDTAAVLSLSLHHPLGATVAATSLSVTATAPRSSAPADAFYPAQRRWLIALLARQGNRTVRDALEQELRAPDLSEAERLQLLKDRLTLASFSGAPGAAPGAASDPADLIRAFEALRERDRSSPVTVALAAALTRAYAAVGEQGRALTAARVVLDARFSQDMEPVRRLAGIGMELGAARLLNDLIARQPDLPSVLQARLLLARVLASRAENGGDTLGMTRSSLRHTAAAALAGLLLTDPDSPIAPATAAELGDLLARIDDLDRLTLLTGPLAARYREAPEGALLLQLQARTLLRLGRARDALSLLRDQPDDPAARFLQGWAEEQLGDSAAAVAAYDASGTAEAAARRAWLTEGSLPGGVLTASDGKIAADVQPGQPVRIVAWPLRLERLLLRDGGLDPDGVHLDGLPGGVERTLTADGNGDLPAPPLAPGAWLVRFSSGDQSRRAILISDPLRVSLDAQTGFVYVRTGDGRPVNSADIWYVDADSSTGTARTAADGSVMLPGSVSSIVVRSGDRYGTDVAAQRRGPQRAPSPAPMEMKSYDFDELQREQRIDASML